MTKVVGYVRASTIEQEDTLIAQQERIEAYCKMRGIELVHLYVDAGVSGSTPIEEREEGAKMLQSLRNRKDKIEGIVAIRLDRCFRNTEDCLKNVRMWNKQGVALHLCDMGGMSIDTSTAIGEMMITMLAGMATFERKLIGERTAAVLASKKAHGEVYNHTPLGYDRDGDKLVTNDGEQAIINRIRSMREQGLSMWSIADALNTEGVATKKGAKWHASTIKNVLAA